MLESVCCKFVMGFFIFWLEEVRVGFLVFLFREDLDFIVRMLRPEEERPLISEAYVSEDFGFICV